MRQLSLEEIENLDNGEIIPSFTAKIKKVFPQKKGANERGDWFLQNMIVSDGSKEITVTWGGEDRFDKWEGRELIFESTDTAKHGKQGLKWEVRNVGDKTYKGVKVTGAAKIREVGDSPSPAAKQADVREQGNWQERAEIPREDRIMTGAQLETDESARKSLTQAINGFVLALEGMRTIAARYERDYLGEELPKEQQQAICSSLFIYLDRKGEISKLPSGFVLGEHKTSSVAQSIREGADRVLNQIEEHGVAGHN